MNKYFLSKTKDGVWSVLFGESEGKSVWINDYRAKSRSRYEMQHLLDHVNMVLRFIIIKKRLPLRSEAQGEYNLKLGIEDVFTYERDNNVAHNHELTEELRLDKPWRKYADRTMQVTSNE